MFLFPTVFEAGIVSNGILILPWGGIRRYEFTLFSFWISLYFLPLFLISCMTIVFSCLLRACLPPPT